MRRDGAEQMIALDGGLPRDAELSLRDVAQAAMRELARPPACARREVALVDEGDGQSAARGVERDTGAGDAAANDKYVDDLTAKRVEVALTAGSIQVRGRHGCNAASTMRSSSESKGSAPMSSSIRADTTNGVTISTSASAIVSMLPRRTDPSAWPSASIRRICATAMRCVVPRRSVR